MAVARVYFVEAVIRSFGQIELAGGPAFVARIAQAIAPTGHWLAKWRAVAVRGHVRRKHAGHHSGPRRHTHRAATIRVAELDAGIGEPVKVRCLDDWVPHGTQKRAAVFVGANEEDIGAIRSSRLHHWGSGGADHGHPES